MRFPLTLRDEDKRGTAARRLLAEFDGYISAVRSGLHQDPYSASPLIRPAIFRALDRAGHQLATLRHTRTQISSVMERFAADIVAHGSSDRHARSTRRQVERVASAAHWVFLGDMDRSGAERVLAQWESHDSRKGRCGVITRNRHVGALRQFARWATQQSPPLLPANPFTTLEKSRTSDRDIRRSRRPLSDDECGRLLAHAKLLGHDWATLYRAAIETGARRRELMDLRWCDVEIDSDAGPWRLTVFGKNGSYRTIPIGSALRDGLLAIRKAILATGLNESRSTQALVFTPRSPRVLRDELVAHLEAAAITADSRGRVVDWYSLRHTFGTRCAVAGVPLTHLADLMGHSTIDITRGYYVHLDDAQRAEAVAAVPALKVADQKADVG